MFAYKNIEELEKLSKLAALQSQVKEVRLQDKLAKQNYHYNAQKQQEPLIDTIKDTSENLKNKKRNL